MIACTHAKAKYGLVAHLLGNPWTEFPALSASPTRFRHTGRQVLPVDPTPYQQKRPVPLEF